MKQVKRALGALGGVMAAVFAVGSASAADEMDGVFWKDPAREAAVAASAGPDHVSKNATIWVLSKERQEFVVFREGTNGYNCVVARQWGSPFGSRAFTSDMVKTPNCFDAYASKTHFEEQRLRHRLGLRGKTSDEIYAAVMKAYGDGDIPTPIQTSFGYMTSEAQCLSPTLLELFGSCQGQPHIMVYAPNNTNDKFGGGSPGSPLPFVLESPGTFMAVTVISIPAFTKVDYDRFK